jgi:hypothetical protein
MPTAARTKKTAGKPPVLEPTPVDQWIRPTAGAPSTESAVVEGFITDLPSGNRVMMARNMDMTSMLAAGRIPNPLAGVVQKMIDDRSVEFPQEANPQINQQLLALVADTVISCVISPPIAGPPARGKAKDNIGKFIPESAEEYHQRIQEWECPEGFLSIFDIDTEDQMFIFAVAQGAAADVATFRKQSKFALADVPDGEGVRKPTKRTAGNRSKK